MKILINETIIPFEKKDFPILISGAQKTGTSFFSICLLSTLVKQSNKVVLFSAYPQAKELFREQNKNSSNDSVIIIDSGEEEIILNQLKSIPDIADRIILFKNIDAFSSKLFEELCALKFVIFSGDIDQCVFGEALLKKDFPTKIFFSQPQKYLTEKITDLPKYCGKIIKETMTGIIKISTEE